MNLSYTSRSFAPYNPSMSNEQRAPPFLSQDAYMRHPQWYNAVPPPTYIPAGAYSDVSPPPVPIPQPPPGKEYYVPQFCYNPGMLRPAHSSFERHGTTYYIHNDRAVEGAFELNGTTFFPQPDRALEEARNRAHNTHAERRPFPGSRVVNGTTYFPRVASDQILSAFPSTFSSQPFSQTSTANNSPATGTTGAPDQDDDLPPLVFPTLN